MGFKPMTSVIPVLYQLSCQTIWELATLWVSNIPIEGEVYKWIHLETYYKGDTFLPDSTLYFATLIVF